VGERDAEFTAYVQSRRAALVRLAYLLSGSATEAEDLTQASLIRLYASWNRIRERDSTDAYARTILVNAIHTWRRRRREEPVAVAEAAAPIASDYAERQEIWQLLAGLPRRQRAVVVLRYYEGLSDEEIAEILGCAPVTVRTQISRGLTKLRVHHQEDQIHPVGKARW
jgi:RNA polymerase sigma-70 factor (sigma-E family)